LATRFDLRESSSGQYYKIHELENLAKTIKKIKHVAIASGNLDHQEREIAP
jgi:hypothetical protein